MTKRLLVFVFILFILPTLIYAAVTDYLIVEDIGSYQLFTGVSGRVFSGPPSKYSQSTSGGILDAAGHFSENDVSYETSYTEPGGKWPFVKVEVTQHAGTDSDRWLLHEIERGFRRGDYEENMTPARFRSINGNNVFYSGLGGGTYRWISNNVLVSIEYTDLYKQKPEPIEVVQAYLAKFPSTIPAITIDQAHDELWIKDEMERRLWLCDKWFSQVELGNVELNKALKESVDHMYVFLDYRGKYHGIAATNEKKALFEYLQAKNETEIKSKLAEYKTWWEANKGNPINL